MTIADLYPDTKPSLLLDFANVKALDPRITFTRASSATYYDAQGTLQTAASGVPRFDHDPVTVESLGLLIEEQRTNLFLRSEDFNNAAWVKSGSTITSNAIVAPSGTLTGSKLVEDTNTGAHLLYQSSISSTSTQFTTTIFAKAAERSLLIIEARNERLPTPGGSFGTFNLADETATVSNFGDGVGWASIVAVGNGWYRCQLVVAVTAAGTTLVAGAYLGTTGASYTGDGYSGIYIWGAQLEAGEFPTSYIKTEGSQVTRSADAASMTGANFSSWYRQDEGTFYGNYIGVNNVSGGTRRLIEVGSVNSSANRFVLGYASTTTSRWFTVTNSVTQADVSVAATQGSSVKCAAAYKVNNMQQAANGTLGVADVNAVIPLVSAMQIGSDFSVSGSATLNGHIRKLAFYSKRLTDAQLQALTR